MLCLSRSKWPEKKPWCFGDKSVFGCHMQQHERSLDFGLAASPKNSRGGHRDCPAKVPARLRGALFSVPPVILQQLQYRIAISLVTLTLPAFIQQKQSTRLPGGSPKTEACRTTPPQLQDHRTAAEYAALPLSSHVHPDRGHVPAPHVRPSHLRQPSMRFSITFSAVTNMSSPADDPMWNVARHVHGSALLTDHNSDSAAARMRPMSDAGRSGYHLHASLWNRGQARRKLAEE